MTYLHSMDDLLSVFMQLLAKEAEKHRPLAEETFLVFEKARATANEKKPTGGATSKARQALQKLRSTFLSTTHFSKTKAVSAVLVKKTGQDFIKSFEETVVAYGLHHLARIEYNLHEQNPAQYQSREQRPADEKGDVVHFVEALIGEGISPSQLRYLSDWMYPLIGRLIRDAKLDADQPDNLWRYLYDVGLLEAYAGVLSDEQARILEEVSTFRADPAALDRVEQFEKRFAHASSLTSAFKVRAQCLLDKANELRLAEERVIFDAIGHQRLAQTVTLGKLLALPAGELSRVDALVRIIHDPTWASADTENDMNSRLVVNLLLLHFNECDRQEMHPSEWLSSLVPKLLHEDGFIARHVQSEDAFWGLAFIALELSSFRDREETRLMRQRDSTNRGTREVIQDYYNRHDLRYHIDDDGVPWAGEAPGDPDEVEPSERIVAKAPLQPDEYYSSDSDPDAGDLIPVIDAEFIAVPEDYLHAERRPTEIQFEERNQARRSSTINHPREEFE